MRSFMRMHRYTAVLAAVAVVGVSGCSSSSSPSSSSSSSSTGAPKQLTKISATEYAGSLISLPEYVAIDQGFFKAHGLDVSLVQVTSGPAAVQAVLAGSADIALNAPDQNLQAADKGQPVKIICGVTVHSISTILARKGWPLPDAGNYPAVLRDLKGAKIGVAALGSLQEVQMRDVLQSAGLNPDKDVTFVAVGLVPTALAALAAGQIDVWSGFEPGTTIALDQTKIANMVVDFRTGQGPSNIVNYSVNVFSSTDQFINSHSTQIKAFVAAIKEAITWMKSSANRAALTQVVSKNIKIDASLIPTLIDTNLSTYGYTVPRQNFANAVAVAKQEKIITSTPTYESVVDTRYVPTS